MRQRLRKFRRDVERDLRDRLGYTIDRNDIIENKPWRGYRLNPASVRIIAWDDAHNRNA
jgi:hypothetical protein